MTGWAKDTPASNSVLIVNILHRLRCALATFSHEVERQTWKYGCAFAWPWFLPMFWHHCDSSFPLLRLPHTECGCFKSYYWIFIRRFIIISNCFYHHLSSIKWIALAFTDYAVILKSVFLFHMFKESVRSNLVLKMSFSVNAWIQLSSF